MTLSVVSAAELLRCVTLSVLILRVLVLKSLLLRNWPPSVTRFWALFKL